MCLFCKIINKEIPSKIIYEDSKVLAFLDINPTRCGHTLLIPKKHYDDIFSVDDETFNYMINEGKDIYKILVEKLGCDGCSYAINYGSSQDVKHIHLHIIPNYSNGCNLSIDEVYEKIKK